MPRVHGSTTLASGQRLRLRLPHRFDAEPLRGLLEQAGLNPDDRLVARALRFDPRDRVAVVATTLVARSEQIVGLGAIDHSGEKPDLLVADEGAAPGVGAVLEEALRTHTIRIRRLR
jgi:hypothetical protein